MKPIDRFVSKFVKSKNGCWEWIASRTKQGYGMFSYEGKSIPAHRYSYLHHKGDIPKGQIVHQICQNNCCVNPDHLILCTKSETRLKYNATRVHPDVKNLIQRIKEMGPVNDHLFDFGFSKE